MNERIKELAKQAEQYALDTVNYDGDEYDWPFSDRFREKFAQLIIRECCNIVNNLEGVHNPGDCSTVEYIKEHFGVTQ